MARGKTVQLASREAYKIFRMSAELADLMEEILESRASYSSEFTRGLQSSLRQARSGKLLSINALKDLR